MRETVIIPGRAMVHDKVATAALRADGVYRIVRRGPEELTVDGEMSIGLRREEVLQMGGRRLQGTNSDDHCDRDVTA